MKSFTDSVCVCISFGLIHSTQLDRRVGWSGVSFSLTQLLLAPTNKRQGKGLQSVSHESQTPEPVPNIIWHATLVLFVSLSGNLLCWELSFVWLASWFFSLFLSPLFSSPPFLFVTLTTNSNNSISTWAESKVRENTGRIGPRGGGSGWPLWRSNESNHLHRNSH